MRVCDLPGWDIIFKFNLKNLSLGSPQKKLDTWQFFNLSKTWISFVLSQLFGLYDHKLEQFYLQINYVLFQSKNPITDKAL